jgi:hypothetical protein
LRFAVEDRQFRVDSSQRPDPTQEDAEDDAVGFRLDSSITAASPLSRETATCARRTDISSIDERASRIASVSVAAAPIVPPLRCGLTTYQNQIPSQVRTSKVIGDP